MASGFKRIDVHESTFLRQSKIGNLNIDNNANENNNNNRTFLIKEKGDEKVNGYNDLKYEVRMSWYT